NAEPALVLVVLAELHGAGHLGDDRGVLGLARLEQLRHPRQAAGDVAGLGALGRDTRDDVAGLHLGSEIHRKDGVHRQQVAGIAATRELLDLAVLALDDDRGLEIGGPARSPPVGDHALGDAGRLVDGFRHRLAFNEVFEGDGALGLGEDRPRVRIPFGDALAAHDVLAVLDAQPRAVLDAVDGTLGAIGIGDRDHYAAAHGDPVAI